MKVYFLAKITQNQNENGSPPGLTLVTLYPAFFVPFDKVKQENETLSLSAKSRPRPSEMESPTATSCTKTDYNKIKRYSNAVHTL